MTSKRRRTPRRLVRAATFGTGILVAVAHRPHAELLDHIVYPTVLERAAALLHGIVVWRPLEVWNSGLGWAAALALLIRSGFDLQISA
jgi:death on curing protein